MAVTRIKNNQITDSTVNAAAKLEDYTITSGKIANNLVYGSDLTITGNLTVNGNTTTIDTVNLVVEDPLILLAKEQTGSPTLDIGFIGKRGTSDNIAFVWDEGDDAFITAFTDSETTNTVINVTSYASFKTLNANVTGNLDIGGNISITGNLVGDITVDGNVDANNFLTAGIVSATGNVTGGNVLTGGAVSATANITGGNLLTGGLVSATGNISSGANVVVTANVIGGNVTTAGLVSATGNVTGGNLITGGLITATANITGGNILTGGLISATGNISSGANVVVTANVIGGNVTTAGLVSATGNVTGGNLITGGLISATGNISSGANVVVTANVIGGNVTTAGLVSATGNVTGGNVNATSLLKGATLETTGNALIGGNLIVQGNITYINIDDLRVEDPVIILGTGPNGAPLTTDDGKDRGVYMEWYVTDLGNAFMGWQNATGNLILASNTTIANDVITVVEYGTLQAGNLFIESLNSTGNVTGGNLLTGGLISAAANVTGGNLVTGGLATVTGNVQGGNLNTAGLVSAGGTVTGSSLITGGTVSAAGTVTGSSILTGGVMSATGNVTGGNVLTGGLISAASTVTGSSLLTGGIISATGNVTGGNILTGGLISAASTVTGSSLLTGGTVSATGSITGGNLITTGNGNIGNIRIAGDDITGTNSIVTFNDAGADVDFRFEGDGDANLLVLDAGTDTVNIGTATPVTGAKLNISATNSMIVPVGNTGQRPGSGTIGMFRFNTNDDALEVYTSNGWEAVGVPAFTVIADDQFTGDGSTVQFTLGQDSTTAATIVSINGVVQIPTTAYSVSGNVLTFTEAPLSTDTIDARTLTTTTSVVSISNSTGNAEIGTSETSDTITITGNVIPTANVIYDLGNTTNRFNDLYLAGNSIFLGNTVLKNTTGNSIGFFGPDGTTPATIDAASVDTTQIASGTSSVAVIAVNGNIRANVGGATIATIDAGGMAITGNLSVTGNATLTGNILGDRVQNGTTSIDIQTQDGNANITVGGTSNVAVFATTGAFITGLTSVTGNVTGGNLLTGGLISATGTITGSSLSGTLTTAAQTNITSVGTLSSLSVSGNIAAGNLSATGIAGTLSTASQTNITAVGTLSSLSVSGNVQGGNLRTAGLISATGTVTGTTFVGIANQAKYADLAEMYVADMDYDPGTVLSFGGAEEVTLSVTAADTRVAGVVSTNPSYLMNSALEGEHTVALALTGRVPTRVSGSVRKGDMMVSNGDGTARAESAPNIGTVIGKALEDFDGATGVIEVVIGRL